MNYFKNFILAVPCCFLLLSCATTASQESEVSKYEDYFPTSRHQNSGSYTSYVTNGMDNGHIGEDNTVNTSNNSVHPNGATGVANASGVVVGAENEANENLLTEEQNISSKKEYVNSSGSLPSENIEKYKDIDSFQYHNKPSKAGIAYSSDGFFEEPPIEVVTNEEPVSTGKCEPMKASGPKKVGKPYKINGVMYYPMENAAGYTEEGMASWYGPGFHGKKTANGEIYNQNAMTAAHKTLPLPTLVKVENLENGKSVIVRVNDRGPYSKGRIIDLSEVAAKRLQMTDKGTAKVRVSVLSEDPDCYVAQGNTVDIDEGSFAIQVGAFTVPENATNLKRKLGSKAVISEGYVNDKKWSRVWLTGYDSRQKAESELKTKFNTTYSDAFVVRQK